jgi:hypothetical protein
MKNLCSELNLELRSSVQGSRLFRNTILPQADMASTLRHRLMPEGSELIIFLNECAKIRKSNHQAKAYQQTDETERYDCEERVFFLR